MMIRKTGSVKSKEGKLVRVSVYIADGKVQSVMITGDFFFEPAWLLDQLALSLKGVDEAGLPARIEEFMKSRRPLMVGVSEEDFVTAFEKALREGESEMIYERQPCEVDQAGFEPATFRMQTERSSS